MRKSQPNLVIVTRETRLSGLKAKFATPAMARFRLAKAHEIEVERRRAAGPTALAALAPAQALADFAEYESEDERYSQTLHDIRTSLNVELPVKMLDRGLVPTFDFWNTICVVVVGQDGLVANVAKYVGDIPIVGVNPDPARYDGVLLPFSPADVPAVLRRVLAGRPTTRSVTLAEVQLNDGQRMLAFNDLFIGCASHVSARYTLEYRGRSEAQSSSGVIISTGAGSTGWFSSLYNMTSGMAALLGGDVHEQPQLAWEDRRLVWAVREPFRSRQSGADLVAGWLEAKDELVLESMMPGRGVIFSDGVEQDFLEFNSGSIARVTIARQAAKLVVK